jgi:hypothetical protein
MTAGKLTKIEAGHYKGARGTVRNVFSCSGAPHTRNARARWLITPADGRASYFVPTLALARELIG